MSQRVLEKRNTDETEGSTRSLHDEPARAGYATLTSNVDEIANPQIMTLKIFESGRGSQNTYPFTHTPGSS